MQLRRQNGEILMVETFKLCATPECGNDSFCQSWFGIWVCGKHRAWANARASQISNSLAVIEDPE